jgi:hypothetical protein
MQHPNKIIRTSPNDPYGTFGYSTKLILAGYADPRPGSPAGLGQRQATSAAMVAAVDGRR